MEERKYKVYVYEFPDGMKYVGMTSKSLAGRRDCGYQHNKRLQRAIKKCGGWSHFKHYILQDCLTKAEAETLEIETIKAFRNQNPKGLYNISNGGSKVALGLKHTKEELEKISKANKGRVFTKEHLANLSKSLKGKNKGSNSSRAVSVIQLSLNGDYIAKYDTTTEAAKAVGVDRRCISDCIHGRQKTSGGYKWKIVESGVV